MLAIKLPDLLISNFIAIFRCYSPASTSSKSTIETLEKGVKYSGIIQTGVFIEL